MMRTPDKKSRFLAKKALGQHFLINANLQQRIVDTCELSPDDVVLEIGPGQGAITKLIAPRVKKLVAVELDKELVKQLKNDIRIKNVEIIEGDILRFPISSVGNRIKVIGNLPYNIATPTIEKIIEQRKGCQGFYFMVQKEYADRLAAKPGSKIYGSLSCYIQYYTKVKLLLKITRGAFRPSPKIESAFLSCHFHNELPYRAFDEIFLFQLIRKAFQQRRKTLENSLKELINKEKWQELGKRVGIDPKKRAEQVSLAQFVALANELTKIRPNP